VTNISRRDLLRTTGLMLAASGARAVPSVPVAEEPRPAGTSEVARSPEFRGNEWLRSARILNAEAYNPPFYPALTYNPAKAVKIAQELGANTFRFPAAAYYAYFPTQTKYPRHPELKGDPMRETLELCRKAGLKVIAYVPVNHPFMEVGSGNPSFPDWMRYDAQGEPITTSHMGYARYHEGCLNSPLRNEIFALVQEVLTYDPDVVYFDGPYQGMDNRSLFCHCHWCQVAYKAAENKEIPIEHGDAESVIAYTRWMAGVCKVTFQELGDFVQKKRRVPVLYNNTALLSRREWRSRIFPVADGFMFESAETPEQKLFNLQLGQSTGKVIWTYVGHHSQYNREHLHDRSIRGWYSWPVDGDELRMDGAVASAAGAGMVFWSLGRFHSMPKPPLDYDEGRNLRQIFNFAQSHEVLFRGANTRPQAGVLVGAQTIDWYDGKMFVPAAYQNGFRGAWQLMKDCSIESEPFLDFAFDAELLRRYSLIYVSNAACLGDQQIAQLRNFVDAGGTLVATHLSGICDEYGRVRNSHPLHDLLGISLLAEEPEEHPDIYLQLSGKAGVVPQDPQIMRFEARPRTEVLATTIDPGYRRDLGPAITRRKYGRGEAIYIGSNLEAIYSETRLPAVRDLLAEILESKLAGSRRYRVERHPGLTPHFTASADNLFLHLLADAGDKHKKLRARESYLPIDKLPVKIRLPEGRQPAYVSLMHAAKSIPFSVKDGWVQLNVDRVLIQETVAVRLS
jgi:hypothetical protein